MRDLIVAYGDCRSVPGDGDACWSGGLHGQVSGSIGDYKYSITKSESALYNSNTCCGLTIILKLFKSHQSLVFQ